MQISTMFKHLNNFVSFIDGTDGSHQKWRNTHKYTENWNEHISAQKRYSLRSLRIYVNWVQFFFGIHLHILCIFCTFHYQLSFCHSSLLLCVYFVFSAVWLDSFRSFVLTLCACVSLCIYTLSVCHFILSTLSHQLK